MKVLQWEKLIKIFKIFKIFKSTTQFKVRRSSDFLNSNNFDLILRILAALSSTYCSPRHPQKSQWDLVLFSLHFTILIISRKIKVTHCTLLLTSTLSFQFPTAWRPILALSLGVLFQKPRLIYRQSPIFLLLTKDFL